MLVMLVLASWRIGLLGLTIKGWGALHAQLASCCHSLATFFTMIVNRWTQVLLTAGISFANPLFPRQNGSDFQASCGSIASGLEIENATVYFSQFVAAGQNLSIPDRNVTCGVPYQAVSVDLCRIALHVATSNSSGINMEAWLP